MCERVRKKVCVCVCVFGQGGRVNSIDAADFVLSLFLDHCKSCPTQKKRFRLLKSQHFADYLQ